MRRTDPYGLSLALVEPPAPLARDEFLALELWRFCGGWRPELLPAYAAVYPLDDPELMLELLLAIREERDKR